MPIAELGAVAADVHAFTLKHNRIGGNMLDRCGPTGNQPQTLHPAHLVPGVVGFRNSEPTVPARLPGVSGWVILPCLPSPMR